MPYSKQKPVFLDACRSKGALGKKTRAVDNNSFVHDLQDRSTVIFTSNDPNTRSGLFSDGVITQK